MKTRHTLAGAMLLFMLVPSAWAQRSGVEIWAQTCGNCHTAQPAVRYTADQWEHIATHMELTARLTDDEAAAVLQFLQGGAKSLARAPRPAPDTPLADASTDGAVEAVRADAAKLFKTYCAACHGKEGKGNGPAAQALHPAPANLADPAFQEARTDDQLMTVILQGKGAMPSFKAQLNPEQVHELVLYLRTLVRKTH